MKNLIFLLCLFSALCTAVEVRTQTISESDVAIGSIIEQAKHKIQNEKFESAASLILQLFENEEYDNYFVNHLTEIKTMFSPLNNKADTESCAKIASFIIKNYENKVIPRSVLLKLYFLGQYQLLYEISCNDMLITDYDTSRILGRTFGSCFMLKCYGDSKNSTSLKKSDVANLCTQYYEKAINNSENQYLKTQVAKKWHDLAARSDFPSKSGLLQKQLLIDSMSTKNEHLRKSQTQLFRRRLKESLNKGNLTQSFDEKTRDILASSISYEFDRYAAIGIPSDLFNRILKDLDFWFDKGIDLSMYNQNESISVFRNNFKWYLWHAIIEPIPCDLEQKIITKQIETYISEAISLPRENPRLKDYEGHLSKALLDWQKMFLRVKDNRFVPYCKEAQLPYFFDRFFTEFKEDCIARQKQIIKKMDRAKNFQQLGFSVNSGEKTNYKKEIAYVIGSFYSSFLSFDRPAFKYLPDHVKGSDYGRLNENLIYVFFIN